MLLVTIGGLIFEGAWRPEWAGARFEIARGGLTGWWDAAPIVARNQNREGAPGEFDVEEFAGGRTITLRGRIRAPRFERAYQAKVLAGLNGQRLRVVVTDEDGSTWAWARVRDVSIPRQSAGHHPTFAITMRAADPFKYGEQQSFVSSGSNVDAHHRGNTAAVPQFTVTATSNMTAGYQLIGAGRTFVVPGPLNVGQTDKVDYRTGTVRRNGSIATGVTPRTFTVPGGALVPWRINPLSGAGTATMHLTDTYA